VSEQTFGVDLWADHEHGARSAGLCGFGAQVEVEGAFDGFAVSGLVFGAEGFFEWGFGFGWIGYGLSHCNDL
jgi:hypothetical protein